jgi:hypothetical protein
MKKVFLVLVLNLILISALYIAAMVHISKVENRVKILESEVADPLMSELQKQRLNPSSHNAADFSDFYTWSGDIIYVTNHHECDNSCEFVGYYEIWFESTDLRLFYSEIYDVINVIGLISTYQPQEYENILIDEGYLFPKQ